MFKLYFTYLSIYLFIYLFITDCCTYYLRPPRLAPAICGRKWTLCKCRLLIIIKCVNKVCKKTADFSRLRLWFPREMTSGKREQIWVVLLIG